MTVRQIYHLCLTAIVIGIANVSSDALADVVKWRSSLDLAKVEAAQSGRLVLVHFWTPSCGPCRKLDSDVFSQPQIGELLEKNFVPVKVNADLAPALANAFNITRVPTDIVLDSQGNVLAPLTCPLKPGDYATQLLNLVQHYRQSIASNSASRQPPVQAAYTGLKVGQYRNTNAAVVPGANVAAQPGQPSAPPAVISPQVTHNIYAATPQPAQATNLAAPSNAANVYGDRYAARPSVPPVAASQPVVSAQQVASQPVVAQPPIVSATQQFSQPTVTSTVPQQAQPPVAAAVVANTPVVTNTSPAPTTAKAQQAGLPQLPTGSSPLAFEGYCPVTLKQMRKWVMGNSKFGATHRGRTYLFAGDQQRKQFLANPDSFSPVFSGMDAIKLLEENQVVEGSRKFGYEYRGAFYLFGSKETMDRFASQPDHYAAGVRQAMTRMDASAGGTLRR